MDIRTGASLVGTIRKIPKVSSEMGIDGTCKFQRDDEIYIDRRVDIWANVDIDFCLRRLLLLNYRLLSALREA